MTVKILIPLFVLHCIVIIQSPAQSSGYPFSKHFAEAYQLYPNIPKGMLEAISYTNTHIHHVDSTTPQSCTGMPRVYGVMGLMLDGKGYFKNNLNTISKISGISVQDIINDPRKNILAFAAAYSKLKTEWGIKGDSPEQDIPLIKVLSEIPDDTVNSDYPLNSHIYAVFKFLANTEFQKIYNFQDRQIDFIKVFGSTNYAVLSAARVIRQGNTYITEGGIIYINRYRGQ